LFRDFGRDEGLEVAGLGAIQFDREKRSICIGAMNGLALFHPDSLVQNNRVPTVLLTSFKVHEKLAPLPAPLIATERIEIPYSDNFVSFTFSAVDFVNPSKNLYASMMEGFDKDWVQTGTRRYASYTNLAPGSYIFHVKGSNSDGVWNEAGVSVRIVVTPPWYRSTPAYVAYAILLVCSLSLFGRYYRKRLLLRHEMQMKDFESAKLREIDQIKSRFFANISHEFRTPLTLILGPLDRIQSSLREQDMQEDVNVMRRSGQRLLHLINRLLDLSKVDAGQMPLCAQKTDLIQFLRTHISSFLPFAERRGIGLKFDPCADPIEVTIDREKIEGVISNLLSNALKFTPRGGEVTLSVRIPTKATSAGSIQSAGPECVSVAVIDTGIGIPPDELPKVFDRFHQVDNIQHRQQGGTGIGLALAKELVEMHHGSIAVTSVVGEGSTFTFTLPMGQDHLRPDQIIEEDRSVSVEPVARHLEEAGVVENEVSPNFLNHSGPDHREPLVLLVEDNADVRRFVRNILDHEYLIEEAENGEAGLTIAFEELPDIVISDVMMPRMDGIELCKRLKTDERTNHIPVILLTAKASIDSKLEGLETGADDYIVKPFEAAELRARIRNLIDNRLKLRERYRNALALGTPDSPASSADERFLKKAIAAVEQHLSEAGYETATLAYELCMSRMNLNRKLHALTGHSTHSFIRTLRLQRAAQLLRQRSGTVSEIAFDVGFSSVSHFAKAFHEQFGKLPSEVTQHSTRRTQS
jgi:signal transduction histidine kinase/DNA-binding NarL/FixJ family response regulator